MRSFLVLLGLLVLAVITCYLGSATDRFIGNLSELEKEEAIGCKRNGPPGIDPADTDFWSGLLPPPDENGMVPEW